MNASQEVMLGPQRSGRWNQRLAEVPGARHVLDGVWWFPGEKHKGHIASASILVEAEVPLLVDAGMAGKTAEGLRDARIVPRLHLTHMHVDHRIHQCWFQRDQVTVPSVEIPAFQDWGTWLEWCGFPTSMGDTFVEAIQARYAVSTLREPVGVEEGANLNPGGMDVRFLPLPGHTNGHSGIYIPEHRAALVTDYDMLPFGPWYGNPISDLDAYEATLRQLLARDDIDWFITSHEAGTLDRDTFAEEAQRYLRMMEERSDRLWAWLREHAPMAVADMVGHGLIYPQRALARNPLFERFEGRMIELHLGRIGAVRIDGERWSLP